MGSDDAQGTTKDSRPAPSVTADAPTVFPSQHYTQLSRNYYQFKSQEELNTWNALLLPISQGS